MDDVLSRRTPIIQTQAEPFIDFHNIHLMLITWKERNRFLCFRVHRGNPNPSSFNPMRVVGNEAAHFCIGSGRHKLSIASYERVSLVTLSHSNSCFKLKFNLKIPERNSGNEADECDSYLELFCFVSTEASYLCQWKREQLCEILSIFFYTKRS